MPNSRLGSRHSSMTRCGKCCYYCRQVATFLFSHIGLCTLLLGYALVGAFTFQILESDHEREQRMEMIRSRTDMIMQLSHMTNHSQTLMYENWTKNAREILEEFEKNFVNAVKIKGFDGSEELSKTSSQWSFSGALLYSIIVITTIGYGNVAPRTDMGKIVTILYAIIGIPLMLFCLSNIGHAMAHSFKFIYWKCCCFLCVKPKKVQRRERRRRRLIRQHRQRAMIQQSLGHSSSFNDYHPSIYGGSMPTTPVTAPVTTKHETKETTGKDPANNSRPLGRSFSVRSAHFRFPSFHHSHSRSAAVNNKQNNLNNVTPTSASATATAVPSTTTTTSNTTPENTSMQTTPLTTSDSSNSTQFFPNHPAQTSPAAAINHEYSSLDNSMIADSSTPTSTPTITTTTTTTTSAINNVTTTSLVPKKSNLSRSHSARYYNETLPVYSSHYQHQQLAPYPNGFQIIPKNSKDKASLQSIICNKYASLSDECIDASREFQAPEPTIQLRLPPKRIQSQVRFRPSLDTPNLNLHDESQLATGIPQPPPFPFPDTAESNSSNKTEASQYSGVPNQLDQVHPHHQLPPPPFHQSYFHPNDPHQPVFESESQLKQIGGSPYYPNQFMSKEEMIDSYYSDAYDENEDDDDDDITEKNIPITVCLALVIGYICGGAWFFSTSEEWSFLDASYFCFVTLSTIGFGDLVPGRTVLSTPEDGQMTLAICALYLLFGMALLAMSLNLVKEKALETVRIVGQRIGILVSDEDDYY